MPAHDHTTSVEYRTIERYPGLRFGSDGSVWTRWKRGTGGLGNAWKPLHGAKNTDGYRQVRLRDGRLYQVHRLILEAFHSPQPDGMESRHLDGNRANNSISNLCWGTKQENHEDQIRHGTRPLTKGESNGHAKLTEADVRAIRERAIRSESCISIARDYPCVGISAIERAINGHSWKHLG